MEITRELYNDSSGCRLDMTTLSAGNMGPSWDIANPVRESMFKQVGIDPSEVFFVKQMHTRKIEKSEDLKRDPDGFLREADGILSVDENEVIAVTAADCMPVFLYDKTMGIRALLHSGWKGTGIASDAVKMMVTQYGCSPENITAVLGPSIGSCCYRVDQERALSFKKDWGPDSVRRVGNDFFISLGNANISMLKAAGLTEIIHVNECTCCGADFGSFRREGAGSFTLMTVFSYGNS